MDPVVGPEAYSPEWYEARKTCFGASEAAVACGLHPTRQPLDLYLEKRGLLEPFEGNEFTRRGRRFERAIAEEYVEQTGCNIRVDLPLFYSPDHPYIAATPDAVRSADAGHGVEFKLCDWRRAAKLGAEHTDEVFDDWLMQAQQQMYVLNWHTVDIFVCLDHNTYRLFRIHRDEELIRHIIDAEQELWDRIQKQSPPPLDWSVANTPRLVQKMFGCGDPTAVELGDSVQDAWDTYRMETEVIRRAEMSREIAKAKVLAAMGDHAIGHLPDGRTITKRRVSETYVTPEDVSQLAERVGEIKRKEYLTLRETREPT